MQLTTRTSQLQLATKTCNSNSQLQLPIRQLVTRNSQLATRNSQLTTRNSQLATRNSQLTTRKSQFATPTPNSQLATLTRNSTTRTPRTHKFSISVKFHIYLFDWSLKYRSMASNPALQTLCVKWTS